MAVDPFENWITVGTSLGYHVIWDMRFQLPIRNGNTLDMGENVIISYYNIQVVLDQILSFVLAKLCFFNAAILIVEKS